MPSRRLANLLIIAASALALAACTGEQADDAAAPDSFAALLPDAPGHNLIVISFDALRVDALGAYGDTLGASPNLDAFAEQALVCDRAYTAAQATPTSFAAAWTGRQPFEVFRGWQLQPAPTMAEVLQRAGYRTAAFLNNRQLDEARGFDRGFDHYEVVYLPEEEAFVELAAGWLRENTDQPFFTWIHFISPHAPYDRRDLAERFYTPGYDGPLADSTDELGPGGVIRDHAALRRAKELYVGEVFYADLLFGRLLATLEELGLLDNSVVVVTADHGDEHMEHGAFGHLQVHDEVVRIPLLIRHPVFDGPRRTPDPIVNLDYLATFAGLLGIEPPPGMDGVDVRGPVDRDRPVVFSSMTNHAWFAMGVRKGPYKLIQDCRGTRPTTRLYDLVADPAERRDLSRARPDERRRLEDLLAELAGGEPCDVLQDAVRGGSSSEGLTPEEIQQLRALGY
jgi:arylsulfatase